MNAWGFFRTLLVVLERRNVGEQAWSALDSSEETTDPQYNLFAFPLTVQGTGEYKVFLLANNTKVAEGTFTVR